MERIEIGNKYVGKNEPPFIIAEIGINHQGKVEIAKEMIDAAKYAGADAVKFQKRTVEKILTKEGLSKPYFNEDSFGKTYGEHRKALELSEKDYRELKEYATERGLIFFASGWDEESVDLLDSIGVPVFKIPSADVTNLPLITHTAKKGKPVILSTGMSNMEEVEEAVNAVLDHNPNLILMQCASTYPADFEELNLNVLKNYEEKFGDKVVLGYSGHEKGVTAPLIAYMFGARVFERHLTLDRTMKGGDHAASLEPDVFKRLVRDLKNVPLMLGRSKKEIQEREKPMREKLGKSLVAKIKIPKGTKITPEMLCVKSPGIGLPPKYKYLAVGGIATRDIEEDMTIFEGDIYFESKDSK